jgi:hypothetical protein
MWEGEAEEQAHRGDAEYAEENAEKTREERGLQRAQKNV